MRIAPIAEMAGAAAQAVAERLGRQVHGVVRLGAVDGEGFEGRGERTGFADTARVAYGLGQAGADGGGEGVAH